MRGIYSLSSLFSSFGSFSSIFRQWFLAHACGKCYFFCFGTCLIIIMGKEHNRKARLYVRLPVKIEQKLQVKQLHPNIVDVRLPRQSGRSCIVEFENQQKLEEARVDLKKIKIGLKSVQVRDCTVGESQKKQPSKKKKTVSGDSCINLKKLLK